MAPAFTAMNVCLIPANVSFLIIKGQPDSRALRTDSFAGRGWRHCLISTECFAHHEAACRGVLYASRDCIGNRFVSF